MAQPVSRHNPKRKSGQKAGAGTPTAPGKPRVGGGGGKPKPTHRKGAAAFDPASPGKRGARNKKRGVGAGKVTKHAESSRALAAEPKVYDAPPSRVDRPRGAKQSLEARALQATPRVERDRDGQPIKPAAKLHPKAAAAANKSRKPKGPAGRPASGKAKDSSFDPRARYSTPKRFEKPAHEARAEANAEAKRRREAAALRGGPVFEQPTEIEVADEQQVVPAEVVEAVVATTDEPSGPTFGDIPGVHARTAAALEQLGMTTPFPIQAAVIPAGIKGRDLLVQSPTGSGKTLAFGIPIIEQLKIGAFAPAALILVPTRELAIQVSEDLEPIARGKNCKVVAVYGGAPIVAQARRASRAAIVVATPGRLADLMRSRVIDVSKVRVLVLDEADRMLDMGFQPQVDEIVAELPNRQQTLLFSATLEGAVGKIANAYTTDAEVVRNSTVPGAGGKVQHVLLATTAGTKVDSVLDALDSPERDLAVVFVRTKHGADRLCERLREYGHRSTAIHGGMNQAQRNREYRRFQDAVCDVLVATDVFARGMDLDRITHVVNYDIPEDADTWRHRSGRTGRAGRTGTSITMVMPHQKRLVKSMCKDAGLEFDAVERMQKGSGKHWRQVPEGERFTDRGFRPGSPEAGHGNAKYGNRGDRNDHRNARGDAGASTQAGYGEVEGTIASYNDEKGFGFITPNGGGADVFFHRSSIIGGAGVAPGRGGQVCFEMEQHTKGERAGRVRITRGGNDHRGQDSRGGGRNDRGARPDRNGHTDRSSEHRTPRFDKPKTAYGVRNGAGKAGPSDKPKKRRAWA